MPGRGEAGQGLDAVRGDAAFWWDYVGLGRADEARPRLRAGADIRDAVMVADHLEEGIDAARAGEPLRHPQTGEVTTILDIARQHPAMIVFSTGDDRDLCQALDDAGIERQRRPGLMFRRRRGLGA
jgi:hypothetical protein